MKHDELKKQQIEELEYLYSLMDMDIIRLNSLQHEIKFNCRIKANEVRYELNQWFVNTKIPDFRNVFSLLCPTIMEQPLLLLEALEKFPEPQQIVERANYVNMPLRISKDKSFLKKISLNLSIEHLVNTKDKDSFNSIFSFAEWFIKRLKYHNRSRFEYYKTPLFNTFFNDIIEFKESYIAAFGEFHFQSIVELEKQLTQKPQIKNPPSLESIFSDNKQLTKLVNILVEKGFVTMESGSPVWTGIKSDKARGKKLQLIALSEVCEKFYIRNSYDKKELHYAWTTYFKCSIAQNMFSENKRPPKESPYHKLFNNLLTSL
ncbi:MAG: hypothetical protein CVT99_15480 [Bacteroidetes bacterium HGW-Bacteroidetes-16]|jgi:hypothetical protein|nr:MAG: hypothetical protein CVT99_15480 [Bacteroidetes bacterium HGW-Bacteroidetes-16]